MGDVIVEVDQGPVNKPSEVIAVVDKILKKGVKKSVENVPGGKRSGKPCFGPIRERCGKRCEKM